MVLENSNRSIFKNSIILYIKLAIVSLCSIFIARFSLQALGIVDYGLFSLIGGIISIIALVNTIMISVSNRFIATAIGRGNLEEINKQFNINLIIHVLIAVFTIIVLLPVGDLYINKFLNYDGDISNARIVYFFSIVASAISFVGVPYNGLLMAKERFIVFCTTDVISSILKLLISYSLIYYFSNKLLVYSIAISIFTAYPTVVFIIYCNRKFHEITKFTFVRDKVKYKEVFSFATWVSYGAVATVIRNQSASILVNVFFNTIMNTALGIASSINGILKTFSQSISSSIAPQITKSYASGNTERCAELLIMSTKLTFLLMWLCSYPMLLSSDWIISIWLGQIPPFVTTFICLIIIETLIDSLNSGIGEYIFATGKIKLFQVTINTLRIISVVFAYFLLKSGLPAYSIYYSYIIFNVLAFGLRQYILRKSINFDVTILFRRAYLPCFIVVLLSIPIVLLKNCIHPLWLIMLAILYIIILILFVGLSSNERIYIKSMIASRH